ncbi:MAG: ABC transporter ATP-binding protein [Bacteroidetes bacterium]|nr:ABC transporter ATP-binding protein [Bacteroidota bacterium]MDA1344240.1 ABC transporter ATP-binding protein [Bacteroidota bacterium]
MSDLISAHHLSKHYGSLSVLKNVSLNVGEKEVLAIVGPSGAGKTTLLQLLGTLEKPHHNPATQLTLLGEDIQKLSSNALAAFRNKHLGFIFQFHELLPEFSALENVCMPAWIGKTPDKKARLRAGELLEILGLSDRADHRPGALSGGEQQRVAVARALINKPQLIFADEPSGNLDSESATQLHQLFFDLKDQFHCSFVIVTHNTSLAKMADRILTLKDGLVVE